MAGVMGKCREINCWCVWLTGGNKWENMKLHITWPIPIFSHINVVHTGLPWLTVCSFSTPLRTKHRTCGDRAFSFAALSLVWNHYPNTETALTTSWSKQDPPLQICFQCAKTLRLQLAGDPSRRMRIWWRSSRVNMMKLEPKVMADSSFQ